MEKTKFTYLISGMRHKIMGFFLSKFSILALFALLLSSCISTNYNIPYACDASFKPGDRLLMPEIKELSAGQSYRYFNLLKENLQRCELDLRYIPEEEYNMLVYGITDPLDPKSHAKLQEQFGIEHILSVQLLDKRGSNDLYQHYSDYEQQRIENTSDFDNLQKKVSIRFQILSLNDQKVKYTMVVKTSVNALIIKDGEEGEHYVNAGQVEMAINKAFKKGRKKLNKECGC